MRHTHSANDVPKLGVRRKKDCVVLQGRVWVSVRALTHPIAQLLQGGLQPLAEGLHHPVRLTHQQLQQTDHGAATYTQAGRQARASQQLKTHCACVLSQNTLLLLLLKDAPDGCSGPTTAPPHTPYVLLAA